MKIWDKRNTSFLLLFVYAVAFSYFAPRIVGAVAFLPLLFLAWRSKSNAVWIVFLLLLVDNPANFFAGGALDVNGRVPYYSLGSGITLTFTDFLSMLLLVKAVMKSPKVDYIYSSGMHVIAFVFFFAILISFVFSFGVDDVVIFVRQILLLSQIIFLPRLLPSEEEWMTFLQVLYPIVFLALIDQVNVLFTGMSLSMLLGGTATMYHAMVAVTEHSERASRILTATATNFICFSSALSLIASRKPMFKSKIYLYIVLVACYLQVLLSATRGWFLSYTIMLLLFLFWNRNRKILKSVIPMLLIAVVAFYSLQSSALLQKQANNALNRMSTLQEFAQGDITAGGSLGRMDKRLPVLLKRIAESPFVGFGFSSKANEYLDTHVGLVSPMINFGIIGYVILLLFIIKYINRLHKICHNQDYERSQQGMVQMGVVAFIGMFIIHFTSRQMFGMNVLAGYNLLQALLFALTNNFALSLINPDMHKKR